MIQPLSDKEIPEIPFEEVYTIFSQYQIELTNMQFDIKSLTYEMIRVIDNIRLFSCSHLNIFKQTLNYFSGFVYIFIYESFHIIQTTPFRLQLILELIQKLICDKPLLPELFYALILLKKKISIIDSIPIIIFVEVLKIHNMINSIEYMKVVDFLSSFAITKQCTKYIFELKTSQYEEIESMNDLQSSTDESIKKIDSSSGNDSINDTIKEIENISENDSINDTIKENENISENDSINDTIKENENISENDSKSVIAEDIESDKLNEKLEIAQREMITLKRGCKQNKYSYETKMFTSLIFFSSNIAYYLIGRIFALPCEKTMRTFTSPFLNEINDSLFDINKIENILKILDINFEEPVECNLGVDAAVFTPVLGSEIKEKLDFINDGIENDMKYSSIFTFVVEPLDPKYPSFPVNVLIKNNGFADKSIDIRRKEIIEKLHSLNMNFIFVSSDGDHFFDEDHYEAFEEYKELIEQGASIDEIEEHVVEVHIKNKPWPLSDPLHLVKNVRSESLFREIGIFIFNKFNQNELQNYVSNKNCLNDKSSQGSMKDSYPLSLFGYESFMNSMDNSNVNFYICPMFLFIEVLGNSEISIEIRKKYLSTTFIFIVYYLHQLPFLRTITTRISLIRFLNTIVGIYYCLKRDMTNLFHLGTYPIECFYGYIRVDCHFNHTLFNVLHSIAKSILTTYFMNELELKRKKIRGRKSIGGVIISSIKQKGYFPFEPDEFFIFYLRKLYNLPIEKSVAEKFNSWIQYLKDNQSEIQDVYNQGKLAGCNIFCRNIVVSSENKNPDSQKEKSKIKVIKSYIKNLLIQQYVSELRNDILKLLNDTLNECNNNSLLFLNKVFGFIINKKEYVPKESDKDKFILNLFKNYHQLKRREKRRYSKFLSDGHQYKPQKIQNSSFPINSNKNENSILMSPNHNTDFRLFISPPHPSLHNRTNTQININCQSIRFESDSNIENPNKNQ